MQKYHNTLQDSAGNIITTASVYVYLAGTGTLATLYQDDEIATYSNPFTVSDANYDTNGAFFFKAANGDYDIKIVGATTNWLEDVTLFDYEDDETFWDKDDLTKAIGNINCPLVNIPFKNSLAGDFAGTLSFARSTVATYVDRYGVVQSAAIDEARFEEKGLLIEGSSTNLLTYSEQFDNATWTKAAGVTVTANTVTAPDGTTTADTLDCTSAANFQGISQSVTIANDTETRTNSVWLKAGTATTFMLSIQYHTGGTFKSEDLYINLTNEWVRYEISSANNGTGNTGIGINIRTDGYASSKGTVYIWAGQLEQLPFASSYIPTTTAAATRTADNVTLTYADNIPDIRGDLSIITDFDLLASSLNGNKYLFSLVPSGGAAEDLSIWFWSGSTDHLGNYYDGVSIDATITRTDQNRVGLTYNGVTVNTYTNGLSSGTSNRPPNTLYSPGVVYIGSGAGSFQTYGHISNFRIYDRALTADEMRIA